MKFKINDGQGGTLGHGSVDRIVLSLNNKEKGDDDFMNAFDCSIILVPPTAWQDGALMLPIAGKALIRASQLAAEEIGERLHHAEWTVTNKTDDVRTAGEEHKCPTCIAAMDQALAFLRDRPDQVVACGKLWWRSDEDDD